MKRMIAHTLYAVALALPAAAFGGFFDDPGLATVTPPPAPQPEPKVEVTVPAVPVAVPVAVPAPVVPVAVQTPVAVPAPAVPAAAPAAVPVTVPAAVPVAVPAAVPVAVPVPTTMTVTVPESQALGPTAEESSDPKRLLHAFCQAWKDGNWKKAWYCMEPSYRNAHAFESFRQRFLDDAEMTGGLDDETIAPAPKVTGSKQTFDVTLSFQNAPMVRPRKVKASLRTTPDGYRLVESTILPADLNDM